MDEIKLGSFRWVQAIVDWEGMPEALEHIQSSEILDSHLSDLWERALHVYMELSEDIAAIEDYLAENIEGE